MRAVITIALVAASCTVARAAAAGPAAQIVAVFDIESSGAPLSKEALERLGDYLTTKIASVGSFQVVPRAALQKRLRAQKRASYKHCYDQSCQIEIGRELAAQKSLSTKILRLGKQCTVTMALYDLRKAATERAADATADCGIGALVRAIEEAALKLVGPRAGAAPGPQGLVDKKHCPAPGARRLGEPYPDGQYVYCVDAKGRREGPAIQWHPNGRIASRGSYRENRMEGLFTTYHPSGRKLTEVSYRRNRMHGRFLRFDESGIVTLRGAYDEGKRVGLWTSYDRDGNKRSAETYRDDDKHGAAMEWYTDGKPRCRYAHRAGQKEGPYRRWDDEGRLREQGSYKAGRKHGVWVVHYTNGGREEQTWRADKKHGPCTRYDRDGHRTEAGRYVDGERSGHWIRFRVVKGSPVKSREGRYLQGKMHGLWITYRASGAKSSEETYREGKRDGPHASYGLHGERLVEGAYQANKMHGTWRYFRRDGTVSREVRYREGRRLD